MTMFRNYDPGRIVVTFKGILFMGFADGTFVKAERSEDAYSMSVGAGGDVVRVRSRNKSGNVEVTLQAASPVNGALTTVYVLDEEFGLGVGTLSITDLNGTALAFAESAWIAKIPSIEFAANASNRSWKFECSELEILPGGAVT